MFSPAISRRAAVLALAGLLGVFSPARAGGETLVLRDLAGRRVEPLRQPGAKATVLIFTRTDCPIANSCAPEIRRLAAQFGGRGVAFWLVYPDAGDTPERIRQHLREYGATVPALRDPQLAAAKRSGVRVTPEAAVFSAKGERLYHGRIDNRQIDYGDARPQATVHDLRRALEAVLAGEKVPPAAGLAIGCFIEGLK